jgi:xanthine dehydrogenase small subunit
MFRCWFRLLAIPLTEEAEMSVRFFLDGNLVEIKDAGPCDTLLDHLRYRMGRTGTKEGCAEGDCGACTVLVGEADDTGLKVHWRAVNACILFLPMMHGKALLTVESVGMSDALSPLQSCMAANGSSQCGFCTPGFVMSLHGLSIGASGSDLPVEDILAGNLCRCTGYGPIIEAAASVQSASRNDTELAAQLKALGDGAMPSGVSNKGRWFAPQTCHQLAQLLSDHPDARIVAGATDVGLWVTKGLRDLDVVIFISDIAELRVIAENEDGLTLGAAVRYAEAHSAFARLHSDLGELIRRFAGLQVRNAATVGGNIANGSPIGDGPPAFIALGAMLTVRSVEGKRTIPLEDYFLEYGVQDRRQGEFVESLFIPRPAPADLVHISKLSRRFDSDISAVCGAFWLKLNDGIITEARVAFGGMAATPKRARGCEVALIGRAFDADTIDSAAQALKTDFSPLNDVRGSAHYRLEAAAGLLWRLWHREKGLPVSVLDLEVNHG